MLWEQSVGFSAQLHSYTDVIRIWAIETDHDKGELICHGAFLYCMVVEILPNHAMKCRHDA